MSFFRRQSKWVWLLFMLFVAVNLAYLGSVPGLMGDEGSEGENVYQVQQAGNLVLIGERSYIGPLIDYLRVPFVLMFGYNALALRAVMFLFSIILFWLAVGLASKAGEEYGGMIAVATSLFSPIYILYQRLGWAITLIPFFILWIIAIVASRSRFKWWWVGIASGLGLSNHIIFAGAAAGMAAGMAVIGAARIREGKLSAKKFVLGAIMVCVGGTLGFGSQALVLMKMKEDQGDPTMVARVAEERWRALPQLMPMVVSGSSYMAAYTGEELKHRDALLITSIVMILAGAAWLINWRKPITWAWVLGMGVQLIVLMLMIDRFTLRYFVPLVLSLWAMAGWGWWSMIGPRFKDNQWSQRMAFIIAAVLAGWIVWQVGWPYQKTGGSSNEFSIGNRNNKAIDLVRTNELENCVTGVGVIYAEDVHIRNRLIYLSRGDRGFSVASEEDPTLAEYWVSYRMTPEGKCEDQTVPQECQEMKYFCMTEKKE
jgi:hypothetical protein